ncbi:hypothetical protein JJB99_24230 [Bradyrhizobium diazoefficiens]|uniref:DUF6894 family protein n=1 Tax=Bradyrhizobium diazoefficiens TaxID=1355477 RepID=UPI00190AB5F2|nr:hypothetical protein [Bradyrhizobium diazoefficiens]QQO12562.1 hypothetical protein JJB99_24230 [Bradyrhizobium diazoefficiens]
MPRYYFDTSDSEKLVSDDVGVEIASFEDVKREASRAIADLAKDVLPGSEVRTLAIQVRDAVGPVLRLSLRFEIEHVAVR